MKFTVIDVRETEEFANGHVNGALNIPPAELVEGSEILGSIPKDAAIILYCVSGSRSNVSKVILENMGYTNITNGINRQQVEKKYGL